MEKEKSYDEAKKMFSYIEKNCDPEFDFPTIKFLIINHYHLAQWIYQEYYAIYTNKGSRKKRRQIQFIDLVYGEGNLVREELVKIKYEDINEMIDIFSEEHELADTNGCARINHLINKYGYSGNVKRLLLEFIICRIHCPDKIGFSSQDTEEGVIPIDFLRIILKAMKKRHLKCDCCPKIRVNDYLGSDACVHDVVCIFKEFNFSLKDINNLFERIPDEILAKEYEEYKESEEEKELELVNFLSESYDVQEKTINEKLGLEEIKDKELEGIMGFPKRGEWVSLEKLSNYLFTEEGIKELCHSEIHSSYSNHNKVPIKFGRIHTEILYCGGQRLSRIVSVTVTVGGIIYPKYDIKDFNKIEVYW